MILADSVILIATWYYAGVSCLLSRLVSRIFLKEFHSLEHADAGIPTTITLLLYHPSNTPEVRAVVEKSGYIVSLGSHESKLCRAEQIHHKDQGKSVDATVADLCPTCAWNGLDLSIATFQTLANLDDGLIQMSWEYI